MHTKEKLITIMYAKFISKITLVTEWPSVTHVTVIVTHVTKILNSITLTWEPNSLHIIIFHQLSYIIVIIKCKSINYLGRYTEL